VPGRSRVGRLLAEHGRDVLLRATAEHGNAPGSRNRLVATDVAQCADRGGQDAGDQVESDAAEATEG